MKRFIRFVAVVFALQSICGGVFAQNDEYYKKDTIRPQERKSTVIIPNADDTKKPVVSEPSATPLLDRLRLGGSFGLGLGYVTNVNLSPMAGLNLTDKLVGGVGATYMWFHSRRFNYNRNYYGGRTFLMYSLLPMISLQAEYEAMNVEYFNNIDRVYLRKWIGSPMIGGAYTQPLGGRFTRGVHMTLLYNLQYQNQINPFTGQNISPYASPLVFRITFL